MCCGTDSALDPALLRLRVFIVTARACVHVRVVCVCVVCVCVCVCVWQHTMSANVVSEWHMDTNDTFLCVVSLFLHQTGG